jgi:phosphatidate cytidylyltransferase
VTADADPHAPAASTGDSVPAETPPKAGRNLPAAIGIGVLLGGAVVASLFIVTWAFVVLVTIAVMASVFELSRALAGGALAVPRIPLVIGAGVVVIATYVRGTEALVVATLLLVVASVAWVAVNEGAEKLGGVAASIFVVCYVSFLAGFAVLLAVPHDGPRRVIAFVATVVCSDTGGYAVGVFLGKHPMAPSVSPKKSWEGFGGSVSACALCGGLLFPLTLHASWWQGVVFGLAVVVTATIGDLSESLIKRDLGIKDMGHLLPGHGGVMDRLDSLLLTAPVAWALLTAFVPWPR